MQKDQKGTQIHRAQQAKHCSHPKAPRRHANLDDQCGVFSFFLRELGDETRDHRSAQCSI